MTHFTDAELIRWSDGGPGADRDRVVAHAAECGACAARYAAAVRTRAPAPGTAVEDTEDLRQFRDAGLRFATAPAQAVPFARRVVRVVAPLAAAALVVLAVLVARRGAEQPAAPAPVLRGATLHALAPEGETAVDGRFEWSSGIAAPRYRVTVGGASDPLYSMIVTSSPVPFPEDLRRLLSPGTSYWWTVTALDGQGRDVAASERRVFTIRTP